MGLCKQSNGEMKEEIDMHGNVVLEQIFCHGVLVRTPAENGGEIVRCAKCGFTYLSRNGFKSTGWYSK